MNTPSFEQIRDQQKDTWNKFSAGWTKWDPITMAFLKPVGDEIIAALQLPETANVLDIATGTGEPGLTIAGLRPKGRVTGTDLAEGMLATAMNHARAAGLANYGTEVADVCALPFPDGTFDAISCRMGFMFFPDMALAAREIARTLKPGGRFSTSVWSGPEHNPWTTIMINAIQRHAPQPAPPPGSPGIFRCAAPGLVAEILQAAGLRNVTEKVIHGVRTYDNAEHYWTMTMEVTAPVVSAMSKIDEPTRAKIKADVYQTLERPDGRVTLAFSARIISGEK